MSACTNAENPLSVNRTLIGSSQVADATSSNGVPISLNAGTYNYLSRVGESGNYSGATSTVFQFTVIETAIGEICSSGSASFSDSITFVGLLFILVLVIGVIGLLLGQLLGLNVAQMIGQAAAQVTVTNVIFLFIAVAVLGLVLAVSGFVFADSFCSVIN